MKKITERFEEYFYDHPVIATSGIIVAFLLRKFKPKAFDTYIK